MCAQRLLHLNLSLTSHMPDESLAPMSASMVVYSPQLAPLTDAPPLEVPPAELKMVVLEEPMTEENELAAVRARLNEWAQTLAHHSHHDFGSQVKLLRVQKCHSYRVSFTTHLEKRSLQIIKGFCAPAKTHAKYSIANLDKWRFSLPMGNPFAEADFPDRTVEDSRTVLTCSSCAGRGRTTCNACSGAGNFECSSCGGARQVTCSSCRGEGLGRCGGCAGRGRTLCYCGGRGQIQTGFGEDVQYQTCPACFGSGNRLCSGCTGLGIATCSSCNGRRQIDCPTCTGRGRVTCQKCSGDGSFACKDCQEKGAREEFIQLQRKLYCMDNSIFISHPRIPITTKPDQKSSILLTLGTGTNTSNWLEHMAWTLLCETTGGQIPVQVLSLIPLSAVTSTANHLLACHSKAKKVDSERTLQQRLRIDRLTSIEVHYEFNDRPYEFWLHGQEMAPAAAKLPAALTLGRAMLKRSPQIVGERIHVAPDVPISKIRAAQKEYALTLNSRSERVLCLLDDSVFGGGAIGFVLTDQFFYFRNNTTNQAFRVAMVDLRSIIPRFNNPSQAVVYVNGTADVIMKRMTADQRANFIRLLTEITNSVHDDTYEPSGNIEPNAASPLQQQLEAMVFLLVQAALWDSEGISKEEHALLEEKAQEWAGLFSLSLSRSEAKGEINKAIQRAEEDADHETTHHLDGAIATLAHTLKPDTHTRLLADIREVSRLQGGTAEGQKEFMQMLARELPTPIV